MVLRTYQHHDKDVIISEVKPPAEKVGEFLAERREAYFALKHKERKEQIKELSRRLNRADGLPAPACAMHADRQTGLNDSATTPEEAQAIYSQLVELDPEGDFGDHKATLQVWHKLFKDHQRQEAHREAHKAEQETAKAAYRKAYTQYWQAHQKAIKTN